jgi:hypothetical protein
MIKNDLAPFLVEQLKPSWLEEKQLQSYKLIVGILVGLTSGLLVGLLGGWIVGLIVALSIGLYAWLKIESLSVKLGGRLVWLWKDSWKGLIIGLLILPSLLMILAFSMALRGNISYKDEIIFLVEQVNFLKHLLAGGLIGGVTGWLIGGLNSREIHKTTYPNQNTLQSGKNILMVMIACGIIGGLLELQIYGSTSWFSIVFYGLIGGIVFGVLSGTLISIIQHYLLRLVLSMGKRKIPLRLVNFLDYATELLFLHKVGGGYIFIHRMLMEHFAEMDA